MAVQLGLADAIGDALISLVEWARPRIASRVDEWVDTVADAVRPDPPLTIRSLDGHLLTGLLVADRGQVILFIGTRVPAAGPVREVREAIPMGPSHHDRRPGRFDDEAIPPWARDLEVDPYRRP